MSHEELFKAMGFNYKRKSYAHDDSIKVSHILTHDDVHGLFLAHNNIEKLAAQVIPAVKILTTLNELKVREIKDEKTKTINDTE